MAAPLWKTLTRQRWPLLQSSLSTSGYQEEPALETELKGFWRPLEIVCSVSCCVVNQNGCHHFHSSTTLFQKFFQKVAVQEMAQT
ncbi:zinc finger protein ZIC 4 isoform X7 [Alosa sapidissima]|uniref:zinc finger protein ZIC 4 isoform X7 n=1 Tax=Alosa sapidissima TaxID=34773 RepID=UPI001C0985EB|nr:zinc finger protein ZIC 4 isoform X7 [Alosa sapidissima]